MAALLPEEDPLSGLHSSPDFSSRIVMIPLILAALGGILYPLAFSPFDLPVLAPVALGLLFVAWLESTPGRAAWLGFLFGLGQYGLGVSWIFVSMHDYGGASVPEALGLTALFTVCMALYPALTGWLAVRFFRGGDGFRLILAYPAVWMAVEWFRGWFLTGFTWLQVGYSQTDTLLASYAPVLGSYGVGWMTAMLGGMAFALFRVQGRLRYAVPVGVLVMAGSSVLLNRITWSEPAGEPFRVTLLQGNIPQDAKWQPEFQRQTLLRYVDLTRQHWESRLVIWPETAIPAFYHQVRDTFLPELENEARQNGTDLLIGVPYLDETSHQYYNALVGLGEKTGFYFKRHLVPFGEYLPLRPLFGFVLEMLEIPLSDFAAGEAAQPMLQAAGHPLAASICYEDIFGQESLQGLPDARYLVNVTNDAWFGRSMAPHQHVQMARMRALETSRYLLRATNTGVSALIAPDGRIQARAPLFETGDVTGVIQPLQGTTPYIRWGDSPFVILLASILGWTRWKTVRLGQETLHPPSTPETPDESLRRAVLIVALANLAYFFVEYAVAKHIGSVSLFADSIDFLEDAAVNILIVVALGWSMKKRSYTGMALACILLIPGLSVLWTAWQKFQQPIPPEPWLLSAAGLGALVVNVGCAYLLARFRHHAGSLTRAAFLSARNDAIANIAIMGAGFLTLQWPTGWPDLIVGLGIAAMNADAAREVWEAARNEHAEAEP